MCLLCILIAKKKQKQKQRKFVCSSVRELPFHHHRRRLVFVVAGCYYCCFGFMSVREHWMETWSSGSCSFAVVAVAVFIPHSLVGWAYKI